jgi:RNA recognition motif-containing protein
MIAPRHIWRLFLGQVPKHFTEEQIKKIFEVFGEVVEIHLMTDSSTGESKGMLVDI